MQDPTGAEIGEVLGGIRLRIGAEQGGHVGSFAVVIVGQIAFVETGAPGGIVHEFMSGCFGLGGHDIDSAVLIMGEATVGSHVEPGTVGTADSVGRVELDCPTLFDKIITPGDRELLIGDDQGIAGASGMKIPRLDVAQHGAAAGISGDRQVVVTQLSEQDIELVHGHDVVEAAVGYGDAAFDSGGASVGVGSGGIVMTDGDIGVDFGRVGVNSEGGQEDAQGDNEGDALVVVEEDFLGARDVASIDERGQVAGQTGLVGDDLDDVVGGDRGGGFGSGGGDSKEVEQEQEGEQEAETGPERASSFHTKHSFAKNVVMSNEKVELLRCYI